MIKENHIIHITHNDGDAVGCALVAALVYYDSDVEENTYFCAIGTQDEKLKEVVMDEINKGTIPQIILISDLSLKEETCNWLQMLVRDYKIMVKGIDHHITNHLDEKYPDMWKVYSAHYENEMNSVISAAEAMLFKVFSQYEQNKFFNDLICMISRYDTWEWKNHPYDWSKEYPGIREDIVAVNCKFMGPEECFKMLFKWYFYCGLANTEDIVPPVFKSIYNAVKKSEKNFMDVIPVKAHVAKLLEDYTAAFFPFENDHANAACEYIYNNYDYIDIVIVLYPSSNKIGLRTKKDINLGELVKKYWGDNAGGHPAAAGATISKVEMLGMMSSYLITSETLADYDKKVKGGEDIGDETGN